MPVDVRNQLLAFYAELWTSDWGRGHVPFDVIETDVIDHLATLSAYRFGAGDAVAGAQELPRVGRRPRPWAEPWPI